MSQILRLEGLFRTYLVKVDDGLPELVLELVEVPHTNLTEVTRVVLVDVGTVVVLTTGHTATTGRLAVLADTTFTGRDMATVLAGLGETGRHCGGFGVVVGSKSSLVKSRSASQEKLCFSNCGVRACQGQILGRLTFEAATSLCERERFRALDFPARSSFRYPCESESTWIGQPIRQTPPHIIMRRPVLNSVCAACRHCSQQQPLLNRVSRRYVQISATPSSTEPTQTLNPTNGGSNSSLSAGRIEHLYTMHSVYM